MRNTAFCTLPHLAGKKSLKKTHYLILYCKVMCHNIITKHTVHCISHSRPPDKALVLAVCYKQVHYAIIVHCYKPSGLGLPSRTQEIIKHRSYPKRPTVITHILSVLSSPVFSFENLSSRKRSLKKPALQI